MIRFVMPDGELEASESDLKALRSEMFDTMLSTSVGTTKRIELDHSKRAVKGVLGYREWSSKVAKYDDLELLSEMATISDYFRMKEATLFLVKRFLEKFGVAKVTPAMLELGMRVAHEIIMSRVSPKVYADLAVRDFDMEPVKGFCERSRPSLWTGFFKDASILICDDKRCTPGLFAEYFQPLTMDDPMKLCNYVSRRFLDAESALKILAMKDYRSWTGTKMIKLGGNPLHVKVMFEYTRHDYTRTERDFWLTATARLPSSRFGAVEIWSAKPDEKLAMMSFDEFQASKPSRFRGDSKIDLLVYAIL